MNNKKTEADVTNAIKAEAANARLQSLPGFEVKRWETAETDDDGRRQVTFEYAHTYGRSWLNLEQFCEEVEDRLARWRDGRYLVTEAAQVLANANPKVYVESLCEDMRKAIQNNELKLCRNGIPVDAKDIAQTQLSLHTVLQNDVNSWLVEMKAGYALAYPYESATVDDLARRDFNAWMSADSPHNAEYQAAYAKAWKALDRMPVVMKEIQEWENAQPDTVKEKQEKVRNLAALKTELAALQELVNPGQSEQRLPVPPAPPVVAVGASDAPAIPKNQRPNLLTPLIEKAQRGETDLFSAAVIWPKLCDMAERKTTPFIGKTESGLQWIDANDNPQFLTKDALGDRLRRQKNPR